LALNNKGLALGRLGNYTGAIKYYDKALAIGQQDKLIDLLIALSTIFMWTNYDKALAIGQQDKLIDLLIALSTIFMWTRIYIN